MTDRITYRTGAKWESIVGYSRGVRKGNVIEISGTCSVGPDGAPHAPGDPYRQTQRALEIIVHAVQELGGQVEDIVRTRMYVTNISDWEEIGRAHGEIFRTIGPVTTMVEVSKLIAPEYVVEIEATAILS